MVWALRMVTRPVYAAGQTRLSSNVIRVLHMQGLPKITTTKAHVLQRDVLASVRGGWIPEEGGRRDWVWTCANDPIMELAYVSDRRPTSRLVPSAPPNTGYVRRGSSRKSPAFPPVVGFNHTRSKACVSSNPERTTSCSCFPHAVGQPVEQQLELRAGSSSLRTLLWVLSLVESKRLNSAPIPGNGTTSGLWESNKPHCQACSLRANDLTRSYIEPRSVFRCQPELGCAHTILLHENSIESLTTMTRKQSEWNLMAELA